MPKHAFNSKCGIKLIKRKDRKEVVIATDLHKTRHKAGISITNACEKIAELICKDYNITPDQLVFIEYFPKAKDFIPHDKEIFNVVAFDSIQGQYRNPKRKELTVEEFRHIIK